MSDSTKAGDAIRSRTRSSGTSRFHSEGGCPVATGSSPGGVGLAFASDLTIRTAIADMVAEADYPCVVAKSVFRHDQVKVVVMEGLADPRGAERLYSELAQFVTAHPAVPEGALPSMASFVVAFRGPVPSSEREFESLLWRQLTQLHGVDDVAWDPAVSSDPGSADFGFSVAGRAFFVIGMHPAASRMARRAPLPLLVFNLHNQFEQLRSAGRFEGVRDLIRRRDEELQGQINPMVADHGSRSEARQYAGRAVSQDWLPPYSFGAEVSAGRR